MEDELEAARQRLDATRQQIALEKKQREDTPPKKAEKGPDQNLDHYLLDLINTTILAPVKFDLHSNEDGIFFRDLHKTPPMPINRVGMKTVEEACRFMGGWLLRMRIQNVEAWKKSH